MKSKKRLFLALLVAGLSVALCLCLGGGGCGVGKAMVDSAVGLSEESNERYGGDRVNDVASQVADGDLGFRQVDDCSECNFDEECKIEHKDGEEQVMCYLTE